jgi:hypothetical protein
VFAQYQLEDFSYPHRSEAFATVVFQASAAGLSASDFSDFRACSAISRSDFPSVHYRPVHFRLRFVPAASLQSEPWCQ